jgi:hypothetical protein
MTRLSFVLLVGIAAAQKTAVAPQGQGSDKAARVEATLHLDKTAIRAAAGEGMPEGVVVVDVTVTPAEGQRLTLNRDDFLLRSDRDGQRSTPYSPTQIAGSSVLVVSTNYAGARVMQDNNGPIWGGIGGGRPQRLGNDNPAIGNAASQESVVAKVDPSSGKDKESPLLAVLKAKILAENEISAPVSGQLYFLMDGKQKVKDIELIYKTPASKLSVRFK